MFWVYSLALPLGKEEPYFLFGGVLLALVQVGPDDGSLASQTNQSDQFLVALSIPTTR